MKYSVFQINDDQTGTLLGEFDQLADAQVFINDAPTGNYRLEYGDAAQSTIVSIYEIP